jgi:c-di-GMP-binding flagellar brake protein YcgR
VTRAPAGERRSHRRVDTRVELQSAPDSGEVVARMVTSNLSAGGVQCVSSVDFPEMTRLGVRLMLPSDDGAPGDLSPVDVEAVVVRRRVLAPLAGESRYELALFFTRVDDESRRFLARFVERSAIRTAYH